MYCTRFVVQLHLLSVSISFTVRNFGPWAVFQLPDALYLMYEVGGGKWEEKVGLKLSIEKGMLR